MLINNSLIPLIKFSLSLYKKSSLGANPPEEEDSDWPKISTPALKINVDNKANFRYSERECFRLIDASIC